MFNVSSNAKKFMGGLYAWANAQNVNTARALNKGAMWVRNDVLRAMKNTPRRVFGPQLAPPDVFATAPQSQVLAKTKDRKLISVKGFVNKRGGKGHVPSAVGFAPAIDTGRLVGSIKLDFAKPAAHAVAMVFTRVKYAKALEYGRRGNERRTARPFLWPALKKNDDRILAEVLKARRMGTNYK